jgi:hypothetical protein
MSPTLERRLSWGLALAICLGLALFATDPAWRAPGRTVVCAIVHPDCPGNQWLLAWVAERLASFEGLAHNPRYYWPVGDAPFLAGNGGEGLLAAPLLWALGWPAGASLYLSLLLAANGLAAFFAARAAGAGRAGSLLAAAAVTTLSYALQELSSGRFTQADLVWMLLFLGAWLRFLEAPSRRRALVAALLLTATSVFYWYYGFFMVLAGALLLAGRRSEGPFPWRPLFEFSLAFLLTVAGPLAWFLLRWKGLPGTDEALFPHPEAIADSLAPDWPFRVRGGRFVGQALPALVVLLATLGLGRLLLRRSTRPSLDLALLSLWGLFFSLALGPRFLEAPVSPYTLLYGLADPLRRFWWPSRHIVVANLALVLLAARALPALSFRRDLALGVALAALLPLNLAVQGVSPQARVTPLSEWPPPFYTALRDAPGELLLDLPISPRASVSERPVLYQLAHGKTLINGHAQWVSRVRPSAWDAFVAGNSFLAALGAVEEARGGERFEFEARDLQSLAEAGLGVIVVNYEHYPVALSRCAHLEQQVLLGLFGQPISRMDWAWAFGVASWNGETSVPSASCTWPQELSVDGSVPRSPRTFRSNVFRGVRDAWILRGPLGPGAVRD